LFTGDNLYFVSVTNNLDLHHQTPVDLVVPCCTLWSIRLFPIHRKRTSTSDGTVPLFSEPSGISHIFCSSLQTSSEVEAYSGVHQSEHRDRAPSPSPRDTAELRQKAKRARNFIDRNRDFLRLVIISRTFSCIQDHHPSRCHILCS
jgi:hypothetical protein